MNIKRRALALVILTASLPATSALVEAKHKKPDAVATPTPEPTTTPTPDPTPSSPTPPTTPASPGPM